MLEIVSYQNIKGALIFSGLQSSPLYGRTITFNHCPIDGHLRCFQSYAVKNNAVIKKYCRQNFTGKHLLNKRSMEVWANFFLYHPHSSFSCLYYMFYDPSIENASIFSK